MVNLTHTLRAIVLQPLQDTGIGFLNLEKMKEFDWFLNIYIWL